MGNTTISKLRMPRERPISHRNAMDTYQKWNSAKPVGMANMCKGLVDYWDKVADQGADLAKAHREMTKASGCVG